MKGGWGSNGYGIDGVERLYRRRCSAHEGLARWADQNAIDVGIAELVLQDEQGSRIYRSTVHAATGA